MSTVCIVGMAPETRELWYDEPEGELWGLNQGHTLFPVERQAHFTRWFQIHPWEEMVARQSPREGHLEWLKEASTRMTVYLEEVNPEMPDAVAYPYQAVTRDLGTEYFTSAIAFMLALAIHEGFSLIKLYGVSMAAGTEYFEQRPSLEYLAGIAHSRGISLWVPESCGLFKGPKYAKTVYIRSSTVARRMAEIMRRKAVVKDELNAAVGALNTLKELLRLEVGEGRGIIQDAYEKSLGAYNSRKEEFFSLHGAEELCEELLREALKGQQPEPDGIEQAARAQRNGYSPELEGVKVGVWEREPSQS